MSYLTRFYSPAPDEVPGAQRDASRDGNKDPFKDDKEMNKKVLENDAEPKPKGRSKIKDALQEWSNDDERDRAIDDSSPLRSGL